MLAPYQVSPPQGNLLGSVLDFIGKNRELQLDAGTRNQLNGQLGYGQNVDPFAMQKYQGETQRQGLADSANQLAWNSDGRAQQQQGWMGEDRASQVGVMDALRTNPQFANDPMLGALTQGGANQDIGRAVLGMLSGDRTGDRQMENWQAQNTAEFSQQYALNDVNNQAAMDRTKLQAQSRTQGAGSGRIMPGSPEWIRLRKGYVDGTLPREDAIAAGVYDDELEQGRSDVKYNAQQQQLQAEREAIKAQKGAGAQPGKVAAKDAGGTFYAAPPASGPSMGDRLYNGSNDLRRTILEFLGIQ